MATEHTHDSHCTLDADLQCVVCGVSHTETCDFCGGHGFHEETCPVMREESLVAGSWEAR